MQLGSVCPVKPPVRDLFIEIMRRVDPGVKAPPAADTDIPDIDEDDTFEWFKTKVILLHFFPMSPLPLQCGAVLLNGTSLFIDGNAFANWL